MFPFLNSANEYWISRWGDDTVALMAGHRRVRPVYLGVNACGNGGEHGFAHFGIDERMIDGGEMELRVPHSLYHAIVREKIDTLMWGVYPETFGQNDVPFHTKARGMIRNLAATFPAHFARPLPGTLRLDEDPVLRELVEARMRSFCGIGERRLCIIARQGLSGHGKNWGHRWREDMPAGYGREGQECLDFMTGMLRKDRNWAFLLLEERDFEDSVKGADQNCYAYCDVFGGPAAGYAPFARVLKCLLRIASLCVGVPTGPYHLAAQVAELPTVGIWTEHLPSWYDEPRDGLVHVIGSESSKGIGQRPGSFVNKGAFRYRSITLESRIVPGEAVIAAAETLI